jgi:hypothetical protein
MGCPQQVWSNGSDEASVLVAVEWRHPLNGLSTTSDEPQHAAQDVDIAECLRSGVCNPIAQQADSMRSLVERFGALRVGRGSKPYALLVRAER